MKKIKIKNLMLVMSSMLLFAACSSGSNDPDAELKVQYGRPGDIVSLDNADNYLVIYNNQAEVTESILPSTDYMELIEEYKSSVIEQNNCFSIPAQMPSYRFGIDTRAKLSANAIGEVNKSSWDASLTKGTTHDFYAATPDNKINEEYAKGAVLKEIGEHCYVWHISKNEYDVDESQFKALADNFDAIFEKETFMFGSNIPAIPDNAPLKNSFIDVKEDQKVHLIVYDIFDDYEETKVSKAGVLGYFWMIDFAKDDDTLNLIPETVGLKTNQCECISIDSYFLSIAPEMVYSTIGHEFQHLLNFVNKTLNTITEDTTPATLQYSATWFNEMMSMVCEDIMLTQLGLTPNAGPQTRLRLFNSRYNFGLNWYNDDRVYLSYANAYARGAYILRQYGIDAIRKIALSKLVDYEAVTDGIGKNAMDAMELFFINGIINPQGDSYTLNQSVQKEFNINGKNVTFKCDAINLNEYLTIPAEDMTVEYANMLYQAEPATDYYGPCILDFTLIDGLGPAGACVIHIPDTSKRVALLDTYNPHFKYIFVSTK